MIDPCKKCNKPFKRRIKIDGKTIGMYNRKFCLECSPFRGDNTKTNLNKEKIPKSYKNWSKERKTKQIGLKFKSNIERKNKLLEMSGGKCKYCSYNKCKSALSFHHLDKSTKLFGLTITNMGKEWNLILEEFKKCELVCMNCHAEIEQNEQKNNPNTYRNILGIPYD